MYTHTHTHTTSLYTNIATHINCCHAEALYTEHAQYKWGVARPAMALIIINVDGRSSCSSVCIFIALVYTFCPYTRVMCDIVAAERANLVVIAYKGSDY